MIHSERSLLNRRTPLTWRGAEQRGAPTPSAAPSSLLDSEQLTGVLSRHPRLMEIHERHLRLLGQQPGEASDPNATETSVQWDSAITNGMPTLGVGPREDIVVPRYTPPPSIEEITRISSPVPSWKEAPLLSGATATRRGRATSEPTRPAGSRGGSNSARRRSSFLATGRPQAPQSARATAPAPPPSPPESKRKTLAFAKQAILAAARFQRTLAIRQPSPERPKSPNPRQRAAALAWKDPYLQQSERPPYASPRPPPQLPQPKPVRLSLPGGDPIDGSPALMQAGEVFDARHKRRTGSAFVGLQNVLRDGGLVDKRREEAYQRLVQELQRGRFHEPLRNKSPGPYLYDSATLRVVKRA